MSAGDWGYTAGTNGTATIPANATLVAIWAHASQAGAYFTVKGGAQVLVPNGGSTPFPMDREHEIKSAGNDVVFTNTDSYWVQFIRGS